MKIIVTKKFLDISLDREVEVGEILEISPERYEEMQINAAALDDVYFKAIDIAIDIAQTIAEEGTAEATANEPDSETTDTAAEKGADKVDEEPEKKAKGRGKKSSK